MTDDIEVDLSIIGRPSDDTPASLTVSTNPPVTVPHLTVKSATATMQFPVADISLQHAGYVCRGHHNLSPARRVEANGECVIDIDAEFVLVAGSDSRMTLRGDSNVAMLQAEQGVVVELAPSENPPNTPTLKLRHNRGPVQIDTNGHTVRIGERCDAITVIGGIIVVAENAVVRDLALTRGSSVPVLTLLPHATAEQVSGVARLAGCRHARLTGARDKGLLIESIPPGLSENAPWTEAILSGMGVPKGLQGVPVLLAARDATIFDPDLRDLLPRRFTYKRYWVPRGHRRRSHE